MAPPQLYKDRIGPELIKKSFFFVFMTADHNMRKLLYTKSLINVVVNYHFIHPNI